MRTIYLAIAALSLIGIYALQPNALPLISSQYSANALLQGYGVPNSLIASLSPTQITYNNRSYDALYRNTTLYFLVNESQDSFILNASQIYNIIRSEEVKSGNNVSLAYLSTEMHAYLATGAANLTMCVTSVGLNGNTCTLSNSCAACLSSPICNQEMQQTGGPDSPFADAIMQLSSQYDSLVENVSIFYANSNGSISGSTPEARIAKLGSSFANISTITRNIYMNELFPPPAGANFGSCTASSGPWYCDAVGFCLAPTYNQALLNNLNNSIANLENVLPTDAHIMQIAENASNIEQVYIGPTVEKAKKAELNGILNTTLLGYPSILNNTSALLSHISNSTLSEMLASLKSNYSLITTDYLTLNLTEYNRSIEHQLTTLKSAYQTLNSTYSKILLEAKNNTAILLSAEASGAHSGELATLAFQEAGLNRLAASQISNVTLLQSEMLALSKKAAAYAPGLSLEGFSRGVDGPFAGAIIAAAGIPYYSGIGLIPALSALLSLIISIILLAALYIYTNHGKGAMHKGRKGREIPPIIYAAIGVAIIYILATFALASAANNSAPLTLFSRALHSSSAIGIAINGSSTQQMQQCVSKLSADISSLGKKPVMLSINGEACTENGNIETKDICIGSFAKSSEPVIMLTNANSSYLNLYSMYGTVMYAGGNASFMNSCYPDIFLR